MFPAMFLFLVAKDCYRWYDVWWFSHWFCNGQVARCTKIMNANTDDSKYVINVKWIAKVIWNLQVFGLTHPGSGGSYNMSVGPIWLGSDMWTSQLMIDFLMWQLVVGLGEKVSPSYIEEGMRVGYRVFCLSLLLWCAVCKRISTNLFSITYST